MASSMVQTPFWRLQIALLHAALQYAYDPDWE
jgi:hypothetical protein